MKARMVMSLSITSLLSEDVITAGGTELPELAIEFLLDGRDERVANSLHSEILP